MQDPGALIIFVNEKTLSECEMFFREDCKPRSSYKEIVADDLDFGFGYTEGKINKTFEEYNEVRREINVNE